jgi:hypothetical protein
MLTAEHYIQPMADNIQGYALMIYTPLRDDIQSYGLMIYTLRVIMVRKLGNQISLTANCWRLTANYH